VLVILHVGMQLEEYMVGKDSKEGGLGMEDEAV
jgi:hypothetical protein